MPTIARRWMLPGLLGIAIVGVCIWLLVSFVRVAPEGSSKRPTVLAPAVTLAPDAQNDDLLKIEPLFLPTRFNASVLKLPPQARREPGSMSFSFPPYFAISESAGGLPLPEPIAVPERPVDALSVGEPPNPWPEVRRLDIDLPPFAPRGAFVEVRRAETGALELAVPVAVQDLAGAPTDWAPLEFLVAVDSAGLVGAPVATRATVADDVQTYFRVFLAKQFHLGARLTPGFYAVTVGP
ncbi:hypothetical protein DB347_05695 [Opitutaceae bacterium EW11]|nr:hypothetical protein DB347_05695 [Opitutaceae bacterium EW11]